MGWWGKRCLLDRQWCCRAKYRIGGLPVERINNVRGRVACWEFGRTRTRDREDYGCAQEERTG